MTEVKQSQESSFWLVLALGVGLFTGSMGVYLVPIQIGALIDGLQLSESESGLLGAVEVASMSLTAIAISSRLATWPRSRTAIYGVLLAALCEFFTGFVNSVSLLFPLRVFVGIGCGFVFASVCAAAASTSEPDRNFGWAQAVMNVLFFIVFLIAPYSLAFGYHRGLFLALAAIMLLTLPLYRFLINGNVKLEPQDTSASRASKLLIATHILATVLLNVGLGALWGFVERIGTHNIGLSPETIGTVLSMATLFMIAGSLFAAWLGVRIGRAIPWPRRPYCVLLPLCSSLMPTHCPSMQEVCFCITLLTCSWDHTSLQEQHLRWIPAAGLRPPWAGSCFYPIQSALAQVVLLPS